MVKLSVGWLLKLFYGKIVHAGKRKCNIAQVRELTPDVLVADSSDKIPVLVKHGAADVMNGLDWDADSFTKRYGDHTVQVRDQREFPYKGTSARELLSLRIRDYVGSPELWKNPVFENRNSVWAKSVHADLNISALPAYHIRGLRGTPIVSFGADGTGIGFHQHPETWLLQLKGRKTWYMVNGKLPRPEVRSDTCSYSKRRPDMDGKGKFLFCTASPGDILYLPNWWWHATCNLDKWTLAVGGMFDVTSLPAAHRAVIDLDVGVLRSASQADLSFQAKAQHIFVGTPLQLAAYTAKVSMLPVFKELGVDLKFQGESPRGGPGTPPMHVGVESGHLEVVRWFIEEGGLDPNLPAGSQGCTVLQIAVHYGHSEMVEWLLRQPSSNPKVRDKNGRVALHFAAHRGDMAMTEKLLKKWRGGRSAKDSDGATPGQLAAEAGSMEVAKYLDFRKEL